MNIPKFPKIFALGHRYLHNIFEGPVEITEKIDGSQFSFGKVNGELVCRSKRVKLDLDNPQKIFKPAVDHVKCLFAEDKLPPNVFYYGETLAQPRHNVLKYNTIPKNHIALFATYTDIDSYWYPYFLLELEAEMLDIDVVPLLWLDSIPEIVSGDAFRKIDKTLETESYLGGTPVEGVVIKNYAHDFMIGDVYFPLQCGKYVSERFKEKHTNKAYGKKKQKQNWAGICESYRTSARWQKAVQHLREEGKLLGEPKDIGSLIKEVQRDIVEEDIDIIKDTLWKLFQRDLLTTAIKGLPEWYKEQLAKGNINEEINSEKGIEKDTEEETNRD